MRDLLYVEFSETVNISPDRVIRLAPAPERLFQDAFFNFCANLFAFDELEHSPAFPSKLTDFVLLTDVTLLFRWLRVFGFSFFPGLLQSMRSVLFIGPRAFWFFGYLTFPCFDALALLSSFFLFNIFVKTFFVRGFRIGFGISLLGNRAEARGYRALTRGCVMTPRVFSSLVAQNGAISNLFWLPWGPKVLRRV